MTVTKDQAQMIASLAVACRPHRAPTWDAAGVVANIAKVKDRSLSEVTLAVIRAASDRECVSPGVIPSAGTHWQEQLKPEKWQPTVLEPAERCGVCARPRQVCETAPRFADDEHEFASDFKTKRDGEAVSLIVQSLKAELAPTAEPSERKSLDDLLPEDRNPNVAAIREQITPGTTDPADIEEAS